MLIERINWQTQRCWALILSSHFYLSVLYSPYLRNGCNWSIFLWHLRGLSDMAEVKGSIPCWMHQKRSKIWSRGVCICQLLSCVRLCNPMDYSPPGSSVHRSFQARILEWAWHFPPPGDLPGPGIKPTPSGSPALPAGFFACLSHQGNSVCILSTLLACLFFLRWF